MLRSFELRLNPNREQARALEQVLSVSCELYNAALQERKEAWKLQRKSITYYDQTKELTELRACDPETESLPSEIAREPLRRVNRAFQNFFRRSKAGGHPGYPRRRFHYDSFAMSCGFRLEGERLRISKVSQFRFKTHRVLCGTAKHLTVKRCGGNWIARLVCDIGPAPSKVAISSAIGVDVGVKIFATLSDGTEVRNPRFVQQHAERIARAQKNLARKKRGSKNRLRAKERTRRAYQRMADARKNFCHHVSKGVQG
jgi:putative transposase